jgi:glutathione S-transferase
LLAIGDIPFKDTFVSGKEWKSTGQKEATRWNVIPTLTLPSGQVAGQSQAVLRYLGRTIKIDGKALTPVNPEDSLVCDEVLSFLGEDIWRSLLKVVGEKDADEQAVALMAKGGKVTLMLNELEQQISGAGSALPSQLSIADVYIFAAFGCVVYCFTPKQ